MATADEVTPATPLDAESLGVNKHGNAILCYAYGETETPVVRIARSKSDIVSFIVDEWLGEEGEELDAELGRLKIHDWEDGPLELKFEIGGVRFEDVTAGLAPHLRQPAGDDGEKVTEEWFESLGPLRNGAVHVLRLPDGRIDLDNGYTDFVLTYIKTRGQLRALLTALGVGAKEKS